jgi:hypothetical protein
MKISLENLDKNNFKLKEGIIDGKVVYLINPVEFDCKWTLDNLHLRSVLIDFNGQILSRGLNKFFNVGEKSEVYPNPDKFNDWILTNKEDGSLMICDLIWEKLNVRTRGTISYKDHENTDDFNFVINKYSIQNVVLKYADYTILFEIYSPTNVIVLKPYTEPEIIFLGAIHKESGVYYPYYTSVGKEIQNFIGCNTPEIFEIKGGILELAVKIKEWQGKEGLVLNYNNNQNQLKLKSDWYLIRHRMKSELSSLEKVIDLWLSLNCPDYITFYNEVVNTFDYEIANIAQSHISNICDGYKEVLKIVAHMKAFVKPLKLGSRKDAAGKIIAAYGETNRGSFLFKLLDGKELHGDDIKKLIFQVLKKNV